MSSESPPSPGPDGDSRQFERIDASEFTASDAPAAGQRAAAEGVPQPSQAEMGREGRLGTLKQMALSTDPSVPLEEVENPWDPDRGGLARVYRGIQKATGVDGLPAVADVFIGTLEWAWNFNLEQPGGEAAEGEPAGEPAPGDAEAADPITAAATADEP